MTKVEEIVFGVGLAVVAVGYAFLGWALCVVQ